MTLKGIDVSNWQPASVTRDVAESVDFAIIKATGGPSFVNPSCNAQVDNAVEAGLLVGLYHFAKDGFNPSPARVEADHFVDSILGHLKHNPVLVLDWEADAARDLPLSWAREWMDRVTERTGVKPLFYSYASYVQNTDMTAIISGDYGLWIAAYGPGNRTRFDQAPEPPANPWPLTAMFQFTSTGRLPGYGSDLDLNVFYGDRATWAAYASNDGKPAPAPAPTPKPTPAPKPQPSGSVYTVQPGDALSVIAERHGVTTAALAQANGIANPNVIYAGQKLTIPSGGGPRRYTVQRGDTLSGIGAKFGVSWQAIRDANGIANPDMIYSGQVLTIP